MSASVIKLSFWETQVSKETFCNLSQDLLTKLTQFTAMYASGYKPKPHSSRQVPTKSTTTTPFQSLLDETNLDIDWLDCAYKSSIDSETLDCNAQYIHDTVTELVTRMHISETAVKINPGNGKVAIIDFSGATVADLNFLMQLFTGCSREEADHYSSDSMLQSLSTFIPVVNVQPTKMTQEIQGRCISCNQMCSSYCVNCGNASCANCAFKKRVYRLNLASLQNICKPCFQSLYKKDGELWKEQSLKFIHAGDSSSLVVAHGCMIMALCGGVNSNELLYAVGKRLLQQNYYETSLQFLISFLFSGTNLESVKACMSIATALEKLSDRPQMDYICKLSCLMAANDFYTATQKITEAGTSTISVPSLDRNAEVLTKKLHTLYNEEKDKCAAEAAKQLDTAWANRNFYKMISVLTTTLDNKYGSHFDDYAMIGLEAFLSTKNIKLMRNEDSAAMLFFQGVMKLYKGEQLGYLDIEQAVLKGYHSEWMQRAAIDVLMTKLLYNLGNSMPHEGLHTALKNLNVHDLLSKDSKCLAALKIKSNDLAPPYTRHWPELCVTGVNSRATFKYEKAVIQMYHNSEWTAIDVALAYIDFIPSLEHPAEICVCFLLAGLWFLKELEVTVKQFGLHQVRGTLSSKIYAIKRAVFVCVGYAFCASQEHFHPGMQLYTSRVGLQIILRTKNYAETYFTSQNSELLSQMVKTIFQVAKFCPFWNFPIVMACEAPLLHIITGELHSAFTLSLQYAEPMKCIPFTEPELKYQLYENNLRHLCSLEEPDEVHLQAMESLLSERNWTMEDVSSLMKSPLSPRCNEGWLIQQTELGVPMEYASLEGFVLDLDNSAGPSLQLLAVPADSINVGLVSKNDIWEFLQLPPGPLFFSLDPPNEDLRFHPFQAFRYEPKELKGSTLLHTMFEADYLLKSFSVGTEVSAIPPFKQRPCSEGLIANLPEYLQKVLKPMSERGQSSSHMQRFWIQADDLIYDENEMNGKLTVKIKNPNMFIRTHPLMMDVDGKLKDTEENVNKDSPEFKFAAELSSHYEEIGKHFPIFARLREIYKLLLLHNIIQNTLENYKDKAEAKSITVPQSVIENIQQNQRIEKLKDINEILKKVKSQYDSCISAWYSNASGARSQIINNLLEMCRGNGSRSTMETKVDRWLNNNYQAEGELIDYICGCVRNATRRDIDALRDAIHQAGHYGSDVDDLVKGIEQKQRQQVSSVASTLKSQYQQIIAGYSAQMSSTKPQIARDLADMCKGDNTKIERLVCNWLDSSSGTSELSNYICDCLPSISGDEIKKKMHNEVKTKYHQFSTFVSNLKGTDVLPRPASACTWVPAALLQREGNNGYCMCYGGVLICPKPIRRPVNIHPRSATFPVPPRQRGNNYRNHYNQNPPEHRTRPNSNPNLRFVSTRTNSSGVMQFAFGSIFKSSPRNATQVNRIYLQDKLSTQLRWNSTQSRVSIQHQNQPQRPARPRNDAIIQAGGTILNSRSSQVQPRRMPRRVPQGNSSGQQNSGGPRSSDGQRNSGSQRNSGGQRNTGNQGNSRFSATGTAAGFLAGFKMGGFFSDGSGDKSGGGSNSGSGGGGGDSSGDDDDDDDDQKRIPWKSGTWSTDEDGSSMPTEISGHFQFADTHFVQITVGGNKNWVSLHKNGYKIDAWQVVKQSNYNWTFELNYQFNPWGKSLLPSNKRSKCSDMTNVTDII